MIFRRHNSSQGFVMPMVLILMTTIMFLVLLANQAIVVNQRQIARYGFVLIARAAAKAAVDYAKEELDSNLSYCGTAENRNDPGTDPDSTVLYTEGAYRVTYEVEIYDAVCTGTARNIRAIGRVYIPDISVNVAYVQDIRVRLVRSGLYTESPDDFSPVAWYRSNVTSSVRAAANTSFSDSSNFTSAHEEQLNGVTQSSVCSSNNNDLEFHTGNENSGEQRLGMTFNGVGVPQGATITDAYIQFRSRGINGTSGTSAQLSQPLTTQIWGYDVGNKPSFSCPGNNQLASTTGLTPSINWAIPAWPTQNQQGTAQRTPSLVSMVQSIVNRGDWSSGNSMGFRFEKVSGSGLRNASQLNGNHLRLFVEWTVSGSTSPASNGETVVQWQDQTANANDLEIKNGAPILRTNQLNSKQVIEFEAAGDSPDVLGELAFSPTITQGTGMTVIAVMKPINTGSSTGNDRYVNFVNSSQPDDTGALAANGGVRALMRQASTNDVTTAVNGLTAQMLSNVVGNNFSSGTWGTYVSTISNTQLERLSRNGSPSALYNGGNSLSFNVNQLFIGGTSSAANSYALPGDMQIAELVVYDKVLSCSQIRLIENYYEQASSWNVTSANYNCPLQ